VDTTFIGSIIQDRRYPLTTFRIHLGIASAHEGDVFVHIRSWGPAHAF